MEKPGTLLDSSSLEWADWLPRSLHCAAANGAAAPVGTTGMESVDAGDGGERVSEWDTGMKLMQEWKF